MAFNGSCCFPARLVLRGLMGCAFSAWLLFAGFMGLLHLCFAFDGVQPGFHGYKLDLVPTNSGWTFRATKTVFPNRVIVSGWV